MQKKYKYLKTGFLIFLLLTLGISFTATVLGATAAPTSEVKELEGIKNLGGYTKKVFDIAMGLAGGLAALAFIIGAIQYMTSAGNPISAGEGKNRMISALLGVALTLGSIIVLKTINPQFEKMGIKQPLDFATFTGVYLSKPGVGTTTPALKTAYSYSVPSLAVWSGYTKIEYSCFGGEDPAFLPFYFYIGYTGENYTGTATKNILNCDQTWTFANFKSYQLISINPGIYLFSDNKCANIINTEPITSSMDIGSGVKSISIVNDGSSRYMISEHQSNDYQGNCTDFHGPPATPPQGTPPCEPLELTNPASLTVVRLNTDSGAGNGITFFQDTENKGGTTKISNSKIEAATKTYRSYRIPNVGINTQSLAKISETKFNYSLIYDTLPLIASICPNLTELGQQNCPGSAKLYGNYVIKLKAKNPTLNSKISPFCMVISDDVQDFFKDNQTLFGDGRKLKSMEILQGSR